MNDPLHFTSITILKAHTQHTVSVLPSRHWGGDSHPPPTAEEDAERREEGLGSLEIGEN